MDAIRHTVFDSGLSRADASSLAIPRRLNAVAERSEEHPLMRGSRTVQALRRETSGDPPRDSLQSPPSGF